MPPSMLAPRLVAALLLLSWGGLATALIVGYRPGGPADVLVGLTLLVPVLVAAVAIVRPPAAFDRPAARVVAAIGVGSSLIVMALLIDVVQSLSDGVGLAVAPSADTAYAGVVALFGTCLYAMSGLGDGLGRRAISGRAAARATLIAGAVTLVGATVFGVATATTAAAIDEHAGPASPWGPVGSDVPPPECDITPTLGPGAILRWTAEATIDSQSFTAATIDGARDGIDEGWSGTKQGSPVGTSPPPALAHLAYGRAGATATLDEGAGPGPATVGLDLGAPDGTTLDGPIVAMVGEPALLGAAEDAGIDSFDGAAARHCRVAVDGDTVMRSVVILRWLADQDVEAPSTALVNWRGELDWWTFADGQLGRAIVTIGGYPGDAWDVSGIQAAMVAELSALDRRSGHPIAQPGVTSAAR